MGRETDILLRVEDPEEGEFLVIIELQLRPDQRMANRLEAYAALAEEKFGLPALGVAVIILPGGPAVMDRYSSTILGREARRDFRIVRLWEEDARQAVASGAVGLLPLVPVMRGGDDLDLLTGVLDRLRGSSELAGMEHLLAHFAGLVLGKEVMLDLMRWDMDTATRMTFYEEILSEGIEQGRAQGDRRTAQRFILRVLTRRFGAQAHTLGSVLSDLDLDTLERLFDQAEDASSLDAFRAALHGAAAP